MLKCTLVTLTLVRAMSLPCGPVAAQGKKPAKSPKTPRTIQVAAPTKPRLTW